MGLGADENWDVRLIKLLREVSCRKEINQLTGGDTTRLVPGAFTVIELNFGSSIFPILIIESIMAE